MRFLGGHLGSSVSALVDGQLDSATSERAWRHVLACAHCRGQVEHEIWVKNRLALLAGNEPAPRLVVMLRELASSSPSGVRDDVAAFPDPDRSARARRLTALALLGVGSVSAAVFAVATWGGPLGLEGRSGAPASIGNATPTTEPLPGSHPAQPGPRAHVRGTLEGWRADRPGLAVQTDPDR
jgi:hypothetical protein